MGRHAGWIAAAGGLAGRKARRAAAHHPVPRDAVRRAGVPRRACKQCVDRLRLLRDRGVRRRRVRRTASSSPRPAPSDAFGHTQLGGVGPGGRQHGARGARLQVPLGGGRLPAARRAPHRLARSTSSRPTRSARRRSNYARQGHERRDAGHRAQVLQALPLEDRPRAARRGRQHGEEAAAPITSRADGFGITAACRRYLEPLIAGEAYPPYQNGLPDYVRIKGVAGAAQAQDRLQAVARLAAAAAAPRTCYSSRPLRVGRTDAGPAVLMSARAFICRRISSMDASDVAVARDRAPACSPCSTACSR